MAIVFKNSGLIDIRLIKTFGASAKVIDNPHGFFGSGLKHGLATLLRTGHKVTLYRGLDRYVFASKPVNIRDKDFQFITMTGPEGEQEMPFTTELGKTFLPWGAYRELAANAFDESGTVESLGSNLWGRRVTYAPKENETAFVVEGDGIEDAYAQRNEIFLATRPINGLTSDDLDIHSGPSKFIYYRGVRVYEHSKEMMYTYNLKRGLCGSNPLTEDRTLSSLYHFCMVLSRFACAATDAEFLTKFMTAGAASFEGTMEDYGYPASSVFKETYSTLRAAGHIGSLTAFADTVYKRAVGKLPLPPPIQLTKFQQTQLDRAISFCKKCKWDVDSYPIVVIPHSRDHTLALAENGTIYLTERVFEMGTVEVANAIFEEWSHLKFNLRDMTREFQTHLMRQLINMGQQLIGEPL